MDAHHPMTPPADFIALLEWITGNTMNPEPEPHADFIAFVEAMRGQKLQPYQKASLLRLLPPPDPRPWEIVLVE